MKNVYSVNKNLLHKRGGGKYSPTTGCRIEAESLPAEQYRSLTALQALAMRVRQMW